MIATPDRDAGDAGDRRRTILALVATIVWLAAWNLARSQVPAVVRPAAALLVVAGVLAIGRWAGLSASEWGLDRRFLGRGLRFGLIAFAVISGSVVIAGLLPGVSGWFDDARADVDTGQFLFRVLVAIPLGTVLLEELASRGSLLALLRRLTSTWSAVALSSVLFGLWHLVPILGSSIGAIVGTLLATTAAGVGFCWLRLRSGSLVAPILAHLATNAVAFTVAWTLAHR